MASLGDGWTHVCATRVELYWSADDERRARVVKSSSLAEGGRGGVGFDVTRRGIRSRVPVKRKQPSVEAAASASTSGGDRTRGDGVRAERVSKDGRQWSSARNAAAEGGSTTDLMSPTDEELLLVAPEQKEQPE